jgi:hypothetical protein
MHRPSSDYLTRLEKAREVARSETIFAQEKHRKQYNAVHREIIFPIKSKVMVSFPNLGMVGGSRIFRPYYKGPFEVLERIGEVNYKLKSLTRPFKTIVVHCKTLRHCMQRHEHLESDDFALDVSNSSPDLVLEQPLRRSARIANKQM